MGMMQADSPSLSLQTLFTTLLKLRHYGSYGEKTSKFCLLVLQVAPLYGRSVLIVQRIDSGVRELLVLRAQSVSLIEIK